MNERQKQRLGHQRRWGTETQEKRDSHARRQKKADRRASGRGQEAAEKCSVLASSLCKPLHANGAKVRSTSPNGKRQVYPSRKWGRGVGHEQE